MDLLSVAPRALEYTSADCSLLELKLCQMEEFSLKKLLVVGLATASLTSLNACKTQERTESSGKDVETFDSATVKRIYNYTSPNGIVEKCKILPPFPDANSEYKSDDAKEESEFCQIDFYTKGITLSPKTWSTSPGTVVYRGPAILGKKEQPANVKRLATYKQTINQRDTSGTFSQASLLYYHFGRYLDTTAKIPPSVYREIDPEWHRVRVAQNAKGLSAMNRAGWTYLNNSKAYTPKNELWTDDSKKIYGVMLGGKGDRYGEIFNGLRSAWGLPQNIDFIETPAFYPARTLGNLDEVLNAAWTQCADCSSAKMKASIKSWTSGLIGDAAAKGLAQKIQALYWAHDVVDIAILDYIFSQQDRIGNIDYRWTWIWLEDSNGKWVKRDAVAKDTLTTQAGIESALSGKKVKPGSLIKIMRTHLNDNDAGGRTSYANFAKKAKMLEAIRRMPAKTYSRLMQLNSDFKLGANSTVARYLRKYFFLSQRQISQIVSNTALAAEILRTSCNANRLVFDIAPEEYFATGKVVAKTGMCSQVPVAFSTHGSGSFALSAAEPGKFSILTTTASSSELTLNTDAAAIGEANSIEFDLRVDFADYNNPNEFQVTDMADSAAVDGDNANMIASKHDAALAKITRITGTAKRITANGFSGRAQEIIFGDDGVPVEGTSAACDLAFAVNDRGVVTVTFSDLEAPSCQEYLGREFNRRYLQGGMAFSF